MDITIIKNLNGIITKSLNKRIEATLTDAGIVICIKNLFIKPYKGFIVDPNDYPNDYIVNRSHSKYSIRITWLLCENITVELLHLTLGEFLKQKL